MTTTKENPDYEQYGNLKRIWRISCVECKGFDTIEEYFIRSDKDAKNYFIEGAGWQQRNDKKWVCADCSAKSE